VNECEPLVGGLARGAYKYLPLSHALLPLPHHHGRAVQLDPMKPKLKLPGTKLFETEVCYNACNFCFQIELAPVHHGSQQQGQGGEQVSTQATPNLEDEDAFFPGGGGAGAGGGAETFASNIVTNITAAESAGESAVEKVAAALCPEFVEVGLGEPAFDGVGDVEDLPAPVACAAAGALAAPAAPAAPVASTAAGATGAAAPSRLHEPPLHRDVTNSSHRGVPPPPPAPEDCAAPLPADPTRLRLCDATVPQLAAMYRQVGPAQ